MNIWQFNVKIKDWIDDGTDELNELVVGSEFSHKIKGAHKKLDNNIGTIVIYYNQKENKKRKFHQGIYLICKIISNVYDNYYIDLEVLRDYRENPIGYIDNFRELHLYHNTLEKRGRIQTFELINDKSYLCDIKKFYKFIMIEKKIILAEEIEDESKIYEGAKKKIIVNRYERDGKARQKCIDVYDTVCSVCSFDFQKIYGEIGKGFIHIHHLNQLSEIGEEYEVNPIEDLRPVCPNCHAMLHKKNPAYTINELKNILIK